MTITLSVPFLVLVGLSALLFLIATIRSVTLKWADEGLIEFKRRSPR